MSAPARVEVERSLRFPRSEVEAVVADANRYPEWIEPLNALEPRGDGSYLADVGYFGHPNRHLMRRLEGPPWGLETVGGESLIRWSIALTASGERETRARFVYEKGGSGTVFGASADSPIFMISIEVLSERSLERLERLIGPAVAS